jgi:type VI secretion system protein ImpA
MNHVIDIDILLQEISPDSPCGEDLEYDDGFVAMEQASQGKEEQQVGESIVAAEDADWRTVKSKALELFDRAKDLRVAVYLTRAMVPIDGLVGLHDGLKLVQGLIERYWDELHPLLDPEDANDPTIRVNTLLNLCGKESMLQQLRNVELVNAKGLGRFTLRDYLVADGKLPAPEVAETPPPGMAEIDAAFMGCDLEELQERAEAAKLSMGLIESIEATLMEKVGPNHAVSFSPTVDLLKELNEIIPAQLARRGIDAPDAETGGGTVQSITGEVRTREDVLRVLDRACEYFRQYEPSSPVPLLLERAKSLVAKDFLEIVRDLAPAGLQEVEKIRGPGSE